MRNLYPFRVWLPVPYQTNHLSVLTWAFEDDNWYTSLRHRRLILLKLFFLIQSNPDPKEKIQFNDLANQNLRVDTI